MIDILASRPLAKPVMARRETQRHLDCLTRQIDARAGRQAITVRVRSRAHRLSGLRLYHQELADRLAFDRWGELDTLASRLVVQEQVIAAFEHCDDATVLPRAG